MVILFQRIEGKEGALRGEPGPRWKPLKKSLLEWSGEMNSLETFPVTNDKARLQILNFVASYQLYRDIVIAEIW